MKKAHVILINLGAIVAGLVSLRWPVLAPLSPVLAVAGLLAFLTFCYRMKRALDRLALNVVQTREAADELAQRYGQLGVTTFGGPGARETLMAEIKAEIKTSPGWGEG